MLIMKKSRLSALTAIAAVVLWPHKNITPMCCPAKPPSQCKVLYETIKNKYSQKRTQELTQWVVQCSCSSVIYCQHNLSREGRAWFSFLTVCCSQLSSSYSATSVLQGPQKNAHSKPFRFSQLLGMDLPFIKLFKFVQNSLISSFITTSQSHEFHKRTFYVKQ